MLANRRISTLRQLADHRRRAGRLSARQEADEDALAECASLARAVLRRAAGEGAADGDAAALEAARPLRGDERPRAILEVCALRFGNLSRRRRDAGGASGVGSPPCRGPARRRQGSPTATGRRRAISSRAAYARFVARHGDARGRCRRTEDGELGGPPWAASKAERDADDKRIRETSCTGASRSKSAGRFSKSARGRSRRTMLGSTVLSALADGAAVRGVPAERSAAAAKALAAGRGGATARGARARLSDVRGEWRRRRARAAKLLTAKN